jgi:hypothetical protein
LDGPVLDGPVFDTPSEVLNSEENSQEVKG